MNLAKYLSDNDGHSLSVTGWEPNCGMVSEILTLPGAPGDGHILCYCELKSEHDGPHAWNVDKAAYKVKSGVVDPGDYAMDKWVVEGESEYVMVPAYLHTLKPNFDWCKKVCLPGGCPDGKWPEDGMKSFFCELPLGHPDEVPHAWSPTKGQYVVYGIGMLTLPMPWESTPIKATIKKKSDLAAKTKDYEARRKERVKKYIRRPTPMSKEALYDFYDRDEVGRKFGINFKRDLRIDVAYFYVLERIVSNSYRWEKVPIGAAGATVNWNGDHRVRVCKAFGEDTRAELSAMRALSQYDALVTSLTTEFTRYLSLACGGELRHIRWHQLAGDNDSKGCPEWNHEEGYCEQHSGCGCGDEDCWERGGPCGGPPGGAGVEISKKHRKLLLLVQQSAFTGMGDSRMNVWEAWGKAHRKAHWSASYMHAATEAFEAPVWNGGYGGERWAQASRLCAEVLEGSITPSLFLDRLWTIQHNGGSIFNKLYPASCNVAEPTLTEVLEAQAKMPYEDGILHMVDVETRSLWRDTKRLCERG